MGIIAWLVLGAIAGAIAKMILPGRAGFGWIATICLGIVGALLGGWIGDRFLGRGLLDFFSIQTWLLAIGGSVLALLIYGFVTGRRR